MSFAIPSAEQIAGTKHSLTSPRKLIGYFFSVALPLALWFAPIPLEVTAKHAMAVSSFMIVAWITEVLPHALTGMVGCYLFWVLNVVKFESAFSGFADQTPWFLVGAVLIGAMVTKSGLARRLAYLVLRRVGTSYSRLLLGLILTSFMLTFLVPSGIACVIIMASVALGLRASNLTNRGIVRTGPYAWVRHPAYAAKNVAWWIGALPAIAGAFAQSFGAGLWAIGCVAAWTAIYVLRALTEERHLLLIPNGYAQYLQSVRYRFFPKLC